jgi:hypothetical protein
MRASLGVSTVLVAVLFGSCTQVIIVGSRQDAISRGDVQEIRRVVSQDRNLRSGVLFIRPLGADTAAIQSGSAAPNGGSYWTFTVRRTHGKWAVDHSSEVAIGSVITTD